MPFRTLRASKSPMHRMTYYTRKLLLLGIFWAASGCHKAYVVPETPMPPNTILLSQMMRELSAQPGFTQGLLNEFDKGSKKGPALMTPALIDELRKRILGSDWQGLDRFPGWTMKRINPTVRIAGHFAGKSKELESTSEVHPGTPATSAQVGEYLDLGPYALNQAQTISLDEPSKLPPFTTEGLVSAVGDGVVRGDGPNDLAPEHAESQRLADVLNRLAANGLDGAQTATAKLGTNVVTTPQGLIEALASAGNTVTIDDARYFANFGHFHYRARGSSGPAQDVVMPFWIDSGIVIPHAHGRHLLVPASHAEYEWHIHGPLMNAEISYYFGIDGKSEWRTMDTLDQPWVLKRNAHEYTGEQALEVTRLAGMLTVAYMHEHARRPELPFGGYYALGVCQDGVSAIEHKLTGKVTLFPNTADDKLFDDPRDAEVNAMIDAIPKDREGAAPTPDRVFGSLPVAPVDNADEAFNTVTIPGLAADLNTTYAAWKKGDLRSPRGWSFYAGIAVGVLVGFVLVLEGRKRQRR
jgi:hypothetical protein